MRALDLGVILRYAYELNRDVFSPTLSIIERERGKDGKRTCIRTGKPNFHTG